MRCLHIAPQNISDVPMTLVRAQRALGMDSRLVTFFADRRGYPEDLCLHLPLIDAPLARLAKRAFSDRTRLQVRNEPATQGGGVQIWAPRGQAEKALVAVREMIWRPKIRQMLQTIDFWNYDVYFFDGGLDFFRDGRTATELARRGKTIVVLYTGSDFRTRGIIEPVHRQAHLRATLEWDHLETDPGLQHFLFPFEPEKFTFRLRENTGRLRIGHAPTNRAAKGTGRILQALEKLRREREIETVLIENRPYAEALKLKDTCDIFIDQIGTLGYGINALEALALGIPTCSSLVPAFRRAYPDHPFREIDATNLEQHLLELIDAPALRRELAQRGRAWVEQNHDSREIAKQLHERIRVTKI